jgi:hypothetical protein
MRSLIDIEVLRRGSSGGVRGRDDRARQRDNERQCELAPVSASERCARWL